MKRRFLRLRNNTPFREKEGIDRVIEPLAMSNGIIIPRKVQLKTSTGRTLQPLSDSCELGHYMS